MEACVLKIKINYEAYSWGPIFINSLCSHSIYLRTIVGDEKKRIDPSQLDPVYPINWLLG
jgi:hypothetical protein